SDNYSPYPCRARSLQDLGEGEWRSALPLRVKRYVSLIPAQITRHKLTAPTVAKAHVGRWSDDCPEHSGCVVLSMSDVPLGFGVTARSTAEARRLDPTGVVCFRQADCGEYLRDEDTLFAG